VQFILEPFSVKNGLLTETLKVSLFFLHLVAPLHLKKGVHLNMNNVLTPHGAVCFIR